MTDRDADAFVLDAEHAGFIGGPVSISVACSDANLVPSVTRAFGCRLSADRRRISLFLATARSAPLLRDLGAGSAIAVVFSRPSTHETLQLKGNNTTVEALAAGDRERMLAYGEQFASEILALGYPQAFARQLVAAVGDEAVVVTFEAVAAFEQTPGPAAGVRLSPRP